MRKFKLLICFIVFLTLSACGVFDGRSDDIIYNYSVGWIDVPKNRRISIMEEVVPAYIFAVGHNNQYIIAKQHPVSPIPEQIVDQKITNYFIIEASTGDSQTKPVYGPLTKEKFDKLRQKLDISEIEFDSNYPESGI